MIKFNKYNVSDGKNKARVHYSLDNRIDGRKCVTIYAKDYTNSLAALFAGSYVNNSDSMTDYFEKGKVVLFEDHPLYAQARKSVTDRTTKPEPTFAETIQQAMNDWNAAKPEQREAALDYSAKLAEQAETHRVAEADKHRIKCTDDRWHQDCAKPADVCQHSHWNTGNTTGVSFFYFCDEHYQLHITKAASL